MLLYSAVYNATYMLPEAILTTVLVVILIRVAPQIFDRPERQSVSFFRDHFSRREGHFPGGNFFCRKSQKSC